jgi:hypothetical protein
LDVVIHAFLDGATPEAIAQRYPTASLSEVCAVIAYYLRHRAEIEAYFEERERRAAQVREWIESRQGDLADLRSRLLARKRGA